MWKSQTTFHLTSDIRYHYCLKTILTVFNVQLFKNTSAFETEWSINSTIPNKKRCWSMGWSWQWKVKTIKLISRLTERIIKNLIIMIISVKEKLVASARKYNLATNRPWMFSVGIERVQVRMRHWESVNGCVFLLLNIICIHTAWLR